VATHAPSAANTAEVTARVCPSSVRKRDPEIEFQMIAVESRDAVTTEAQSEENIAE